MSLQLLRQQRADSIENASKRKVDSKVADTLGVKAEDVSRAARELWGRDFFEERDRRLEQAGPDAGKSEPMRLAWITRRMTEELRARMEAKR